MEKKERPTSELELEGTLRAAYGMAIKGDYAEALDLCNWIIEDPATEIAGLRQRAAVLEHMNDIEASIADLRIVTEKFPFEPADFHALGTMMLSVGETSAAVAALSIAIKLGKEKKFTYYENSSFLYRAEAQLKLNLYKEALEDAGRLPAGYGTYISGSGMRTKEQISKEATDALKRLEKNRFKMR
jgi:tetratricopeptide (TPR) repeat protein